MKDTMMEVFWLQVKKRLITFLIVWNIKVSMFLFSLKIERMEKQTELCPKYQICTIAKKLAMSKKLDHFYCQTKSLKKMQEGWSKMDDQKIFLLIVMRKEMLLPREYWKLHQSIFSYRFTFGKTLFNVMRYTNCVYVCPFLFDKLIAEDENFYLVKYYTSICPCNYEHSQYLFYKKQVLFVRIIKMN